MPACLIFAFARTSRWPIVAGATRNAEAIAAASKPRMVCSISGARTVGSIAGCAQANIRPRRSSGIAASSIVSPSSSASRRTWSQRLAARAPPTGRVDQPAPRHRQQPRLGIVRDAGGGPVGQRRGKRVGQRILGAGHIAGTRRKEGDQLAVAAARSCSRLALCGGAALHGPDRPDLDRADGGAGTARRPG